MLNFQDFLSEKVNPSYLYHNTGISGYKGIIDSGKIRGTLKNVSFTRSFNYNHSPGGGAIAAKFIFDYDKLRQTYKMRPFADLSVVSNSKTGSFVGLSGKSRWESEELIQGPVLLDNRSGFIEVQLLKPFADDIQKIIDNAKDAVSLVDLKIKKLDDNLFWHQNSKEWRRIETPKQQRLFNLQNYEKERKVKLDLVKEWESYLNFPKLRIVSSFKRI